MHDGAPGVVPSVHPVRPSVSLVHDYLTQLGGAEAVLAALAALFPEAMVLTALAAPDVAAAVGVSSRVMESPLGRIPGLRGRHRLATPLYPAAFAALGRAAHGADVVLADTSAWAHLVAVGEGQRLIAYCHSPARFLYGDDDYLAAADVVGLRRRALSIATAPYRAWDRRGACRVDLFLANSRNVAGRIARVYGREARVVYPPVDVGALKPTEPAALSEDYVVVSRLVPHKRVDLAVGAASAAGARLTVIGDGRDRARLEAMAGPGVTFLGRLPDAAVHEAMRRCRALILPGAEDFGMTAVEAQAAGRPVLAYARGGALETVVDGETGALFPEPTVASLVDAMRRLDRMPFDPAAAFSNAARFDVAVFRAAILAAVDEVMAMPDRRRSGRLAGRM